MAEELPWKEKQRRDRKLQRVPKTLGTYQFDGHPFCRTCHQCVKCDDCLCDGGYD